MLTSKPSIGTHSSVVSLIRMLAILALTTLIADICLSYALCPYGGISDVVWSEWRATDSSLIDTIFLGSSFGHRNVNPLVIDEALGSHSYNLSTPGQTLESSYMALERAAAEAPLKRVVLCVGFESFAEQDNASASIAFSQAMFAADPPLQGLVRYLIATALHPNFVGASTSVAALFPWTYSRVPLTPKGILTNIQNRINYPSPRAAINSLDPNITYVGQGFATYEGQSDMNLSIGKEATVRYSNTSFDPKHLDSLERIVRFCTERRIAFSLVVTPRPAHEQLCRQTVYPEQMRLVQTKVEAAGGTFMDFSLAKRSFYAPEPLDFNDFEHLNLVGANRFCEALAKALKTYNQAQFYSYGEWGAYSASIDDINFASFETSFDNSSLAIAARSYASTTTQIFYRFTIVDAQTDKRVFVRNYKTDPMLSLPIDGHGALRIRVDAYAQGHEQNPWSYYEKTVTY